MAYRASCGGDRPRHLRVPPLPRPPSWPSLRMLEHGDRSETRREAGCTPPGTTRPTWPPWRTLLSLCLLKRERPARNTQDDSPGDNAAEKWPVPQPRGLPESEATHNRYLFAGEGNLIFTTTWRFCHKLPTKGKAKTEKHPPWGCHAGLS